MQIYPLFLLQQIQIIPYFLDRTLPSLYAEPKIQSRIPMNDTNSLSLANFVDCACPANESVTITFFCHSVQAKRDTESSIFCKFWIPACAGMTVLMALSAIAA
jgi:hypothetical protein